MITKLDVFVRECYFFKGTDVDEELAGFIRCLEPNTLGASLPVNLVHLAPFVSLISPAEFFSILSMNEIGSETFKALCGHSESLKTLRLNSLERPAFESLNELCGCLALDSLRLEAATSAEYYPLATASKGVFEEVVQWLQKCSSLRVLEFCLVPSSTTILAAVLKAPSIRLETLAVEAVEVDNDFFASLARQSQLRDLLVKISDDDILDAGDQRHILFADAISYCHELRNLDTNELFTVEDLHKISIAVPRLEEIILRGDSVDDAFLVPLSRLSNLQGLIIFSPSTISAAALLRFLDEIGQDGAGSHEGLHIYVANQEAEFAFSDEEVFKVATRLSERFRGQFEIGYQSHPDELHESDFSD